MNEFPPTRRAWLGLLGMVPACLIVGLDITVLSVALPTLADKLSASTQQLQWFVMAYTITFAAAIIPSGFLADRFGRRRVLLGSLVVFGLGSLACVLSQNSGQLVAARALLGIGASGIATLSVAMVAVLFPPEQRGRAMTAIVMVNMIGIPLGPILGGWMLTQWSWQWIFAINLPIVVIALVAVRALIPESRSRERNRIDLLGLLSLSGALVAVCAGITEAGSHDWSATSAWLPTVIGSALLLAFIVIESRVKAPLVPLRLFRNLGFTSGLLGASLMSFVVSGLLFFLPQYTQAVLGATTEQSGLYLVSFAVGMLVVSPFSGRLTRALGLPMTICFGFLLSTVALVLATMTTVSSPGWWMVLWGVLIGAGFGLALPSSMDLAMSQLRVDSSGVGSGVLQAARQVATTIGAAVLGSILSSGYRGGLPKDLPAALSKPVGASVQEGIAIADRLGSKQLLEQVQRAFTEGMTQVTFICVLLGAIGLVVGLVGLLVGRVVRARRAESAAAE